MFKKIVYILFLYCFLFSPPVAVGSIRFYFGWLLWPFAIYYVLNKSAVFNRFTKTFRVEFQIMLYLIVYAFVRVLFGGEFSTPIANILALMSLIAVPFFLVFYGKKQNFEINDYIRYILIAGTLASAISFLCLSNPTLDDLVRNRIIQYREGEVGYESLYRGFGFGSQLTSHYSFVLGMIVALGLFFKGHKWFFFAIPVTILACFVNARTGVIVGFAGIFVYFLFSGRAAASIVTFAIGILTWVYMESILTALGASDATLRWTGVFMSDMDTMAAGETQDTTFGYIWNEMLVAPKDLLWLLVGNGYSLFGGKMTEYGYFHSDIGFVNQLSFGGLFYVIPLYYLVYYVIRRFYRHKQKALSLFIFITFLITNFKGGFVFNTPAFALTLLIYYLVILNDKGILIKSK